MYTKLYYSRTAGLSIIYIKMLVCYRKDFVISNKIIFDIFTSCVGLICSRMIVYTSGRFIKLYIHIQSTIFDIRKCLHQARNIAIVFHSFALFERLIWNLIKDFLFRIFLAIAYFLISLVSIIVF